MELINYRGRSITETEVVFIRQLIKNNPTASRRRLSSLLCEAWNWVQANGALCDMVARTLMLKLHRADLITLPEKRCSPANPIAMRNKPHPPALDEIDTTPIKASLRDLRPLEFRQIRRTKEEALCNGLIEAYHYLGYAQPVGAHLKYAVRAKDRLIAYVIFSSAPRVLAPRDRFIGWDKERRLRNVHLIAYNPRFLILPWVQVPHLASHILGTISRRLSSDWQELYSHPLCFLETFVDSSRYKGTCYKAANWILLGHTRGRGHREPTGRSSLPIKEVLGYPLTKRFRETLLGIQ